MSRADEIFIQNCRDIIENGVSDEEYPVRPHWEDGTPAHTIKRFALVNRPFRRISSADPSQNVLPLGDRRNFVDLSEKVKQRKRTFHKYLGRVG